MSKNKIFYISFFLIIFYSFFLQVSFAKNFLYSNLIEICSTDKQKNEKKNLSCEYHCFSVKFDELSIKEQKSSFLENDNQCDFITLKLIYFKKLLLPKNNSPPKFS